MSDDNKPDGNVSVSASNILYNNNLFTKDQVIAAILNGELSPGRTRGYGEKRHAEVCRWVSLPEKKTKHCPHCGKPL